MVGGHIFDHIQGHVKGVFRPGVVPTGNATLYTPTERIGNTDFGGSGTGWSANPLYWDFSGNEALAMTIAPSLTLGNSAYYVFSTPIPVATAFDFSITVSDNATYLSGIRVQLYNGTTAIQSIVSQAPATVGTTTLSGTTSAQADRIALFCNPLSDAPGVIVTNISIIA